MKLVKSLLAATALVAAIGGTAYGKDLVYCSEASPEGFDPAPYTAGQTLDAAGQTIYNRLVEFKPGTSEVEPALAESWEVSADGLEYTFHLRPGVKFQTLPWFTPTRTLNADDVLFSFNRQRLADDPWHEYAPGITWEYFNGMSMPDLIKDIVKVDDMTVKFVLNRPNAPMIANLAMDFAAILSKEYADQLDAAGTREKLNQEPVGTGPFQLVNYQQDAVIRYQANPDYWKGKEKIDNLIFAITTDASARVQKLKAGECHVAVYPNPADIEGLKADTNLTVMQQEGLNIGALFYNTQQPPFDNPAVRKALNMAINKKALVDAVYLGQAQPAVNPIPPTMWSYNTSVQDDPYDPEAAKAALEAAGVKDLKMKIWAMPVSRPYMPDARRAAELLQADFAKVGVTAEIVSYEWGEYLERASDPKHDGAVLLGWTGDNGDPDNFLAVLLGCDAVGGSNRAAWCHEKDAEGKAVPGSFEDLIKRATLVTDQAERTKLYEEAQVIFKREAPWATLAHSLVTMPMSNKVTGYVMDPFSLHAFDGVDIAE